MEGGDEMEGGDVMSSELPTFSCRLSQFFIHSVFPCEYRL